jgi:hypothetical protein
MSESTRLSEAKAHLEQARKAFMQNPTPRLAAAMKQLSGVIRYEQRRKS